jgi:hypothetical protein
MATFSYKEGGITPPFSARCAGAGSAEQAAFALARDQVDSAAKRRDGPDADNLNYVLS